MFCAAYRLAAAPTVFLLHSSGQRETQGHDLLRYRRLLGGNLLRGDLSSTFIPVAFGGSAHAPLFTFSEISKANGLCESSRYAWSLPIPISRVRVKVEANVCQPDSPVTSSVRRVHVGLRGLQPSAIPSPRGRDPRRTRPPPARSLESMGYPRVQGRSRATHTRAGSSRVGKQASH
jgi:hypothetical protein